jgi:hypothetical protein
MPTVIRGRGDAGRVDDVVELVHVFRKWCPNVVRHQGECLVGVELREPRRNAARVVVVHGDLATAAQRRLDEVVAEEAGTAGDEQPLSGQHLELVSCPLGDVAQVALDDFRAHASTSFRQWNASA